MDVYESNERNYFLSFSESCLHFLLSSLLFFEVCGFFTRNVVLILIKCDILYVLFVNVLIGGSWIVLFSVDC